MLTDSDLSTLYDCATSSKKLPSDVADSLKDALMIERYGELFKACHSIGSSEYIDKSECLNDMEKSHLKKIVTAKLNKLKRQANENDVEWNVNIVIGNSHVTKSLRPVINLKMPNTDGKTFEFDLDAFAQFRQQIAKAVLAVNPQE